MKTPKDTDILFGEIRAEGSLITDAEKLAQKKEYMARRRAQKKAMALAIDIMRGMQDDLAYVTENYEDLLYEILDNEDEDEY